MATSALHPGRNRNFHHLRGRYHPTLYRQRHRIENMFGRLKDWRRIAMRYNRCAHTSFAAITLAATVTFWLNQ
jgi:transposase